MTSLQGLELSPSEKEAVEELIRRISTDSTKKINDEAHTCYKFLKVQNFDVDVAEKMLKKSLQWRKENNVDKILTDYTPPQVLADFFKNVFFGFDKSGCPVYYIPVGKQDIRGLYMCLRYPDVEKKVAHILENNEKIMENQSKKLKKTIQGLVSITDMDGLTFGTATFKKGIENTVRLIKMQQDNYPECIKEIYIINASPLFSIAFNIVKSFLSGRMLSKFRIYGTEEWKEALLEIMDADQLPKFLGGTRTDPDGNPLCKTIVNQAYKISEKFYQHKLISSLEKSPDVKKIILPRASFNEIMVQVEEAGSVIEWEFETKTRDIGFGLFYKEIDGGEEKITQLVALQRLETEDFAEVGMFKCDQSGEYVILFDNSYSWIRSKEVYYRINVVRPAAHQNNLNT